MLEKKFLKKIVFFISPLILLFFPAYIGATFNDTAGNEKLSLYGKKILSLAAEAEKLINNLENKKTEKYSLKIPIILYHYIEYVKNPKDLLRKKLNILPHIFENQLKTIRETGYETLFVRDIPKLLKIFAPPSKKSIVLTFDDGYEDFYTDAWPLLKKYQIKSTVYIIANFIGKNNYMTEEQIQELLESGLVEIGAHTINHPLLTAISKKDAENEIMESKNMLEKLFKISIETFAYPFGGFDPNLMEMVKKSGYSSAVSTLYGSEQSKENLFFFFRIRAGYFNFDTLKN